MPNKISYVTIKKQKHGIYSHIETFKIKSVVFKIWKIPSYHVPSARARGFPNPNIYSHKPSGISG